MQHKVRVAREIEAIEKLRPVWERWQHHPNSDLDHFLLVCRVRGSACRPYVIIVEDSKQPVAILVARLEDGEVAPSIGYFKPFRLAVKRLAVIHQGELGELNDAIASALLKSLHATFDQEGVDVVELFNLREDSPLQGSVMHGTPWLWRDAQPSWSTHWELTLPSKPGDLLAKMSSKHRSWVRRKMRELEGAYPDSIRYRTYSSLGTIQQLCAELEQVAKLTYQRSLAAGFIDDVEQRARLELFRQTGRLRAWTLCVNELPKAYAVGVVYGNTFHFSMTGYIPDFRRFEVGTLLFLHMVDELTREGLVKFDFGLGDAPYKQRFGDRSWREGSLRLYRRSLKGLLARTSVGMADSAASVGLRVVRQLGGTNRIKTAWRRWISPAKKEQSAEQ